MPELMDPESAEFKSMLDAARTKGEEALAKAPDTSAVEEPQKDVTKPVSSTEGKPTAESKEVEDETDDVETLKNRVKGFKAELSRIRNQRSASEDEASALKERLAKLEGRLEEREAPKQDRSAEIKKLTDDKLFDLHAAYQDELADARAVARQAERDGDHETIKHANQRIDNARKMLSALLTEENARVKESSKHARDAEDENSRLGSELESLFTDVFAAAPELADKDSELWKAGQAEYKKLPTLTKKLGPIGELIATAAAIAKNPQLISKKSTKTLDKVLDQIETVADKAFNKGGTAPQAGAKRENYNLQSTEDVLAFEDLVRKYKMG